MTLEYFKKTYTEGENAPAPSAKVYTTMSNTLVSANKEYQWKGNGTDGLRSYSYDESNPDWNYAEQTGTDSNGVYTFTDSPTGQPSARRGNLYNFTTATLGSSLGIAGQQAPDSICPRGWQLPVTTTNATESVLATDMANKSFAKLLRTYGFAQLNDIDVAGYNRLNGWPFQFIRTGYYHYADGYVNGRWGNGNWWYGRPLSVFNSYDFALWSGNINVQHIYSSGNGFALRCGAGKWYTS